ncbi:Roadblock/LC7 domain-containing protein [Streptomyces sp. KhCrAH-43]|uniref:roadblock/LC7 domain-containing protein n=1 Tax=unclassified Streptomyces TaxID=2593676 RepID=UPI00036CFAE0|nr:MULTISPECIES: roadblock/LC7 domain-containing protein [unclassified Streptomyces]MYS36806.1 roadblock/LC7 domain-containing protein [Streptomyces sp. SID4920]MYX69277.1 roadblock/LC7 domain-containing protein [Streptomyces sp. SID8373]RAJ62128.1 Roadblock/LC7 domain-containing protein [Streptomyces sp. KhCrAH-43]
MNTRPEMNDVRREPSLHKAAAYEQQEDMAWMLRQFVADTAGVTHTVLLSRDGLRLLDSDIGKDWADQLSAAVCGLASLAANIPGPNNTRSPAGQIIVERGDCLLFVQSAGRSALFESLPGGAVDTVLAVFATTDAEPGAVGFAMGRLINKFSPHMLTPVRADVGAEVQ